MADRVQAPVGNMSCSVECIHEPVYRCEVNGHVLYSRHAHTHRDSVFPRGRFLVFWCQFLGKILETVDHVLDAAWE
jgi:hypothetical protein